jgi:hypothetical protein
MDFLEKNRNNDCIFTSPSDSTRLADYFRLNKVLSWMRRKRTMCTFVNFGLTLRWTWFLGDEAVISVF